jgi:hypothetical protein
LLTPFLRPFLCPRATSQRRCSKAASHARYPGRLQCLVSNTITRSIPLLAHLSVFHRSSGCALLTLALLAGLQELTLNFAHIGDEGAAVLGRALKVNYLGWLCIRLIPILRWQWWSFAPHPSLAAASVRSLPPACSRSLVLTSIPYSRNLLPTPSLARPASHHFAPLHAAAFTPLHIASPLRTRSARSAGLRPPHSLCF